MDKAEFKDFDHLTSFLGDYGFFQVLIIVLLSLSAIPCGYIGTIVVFISDTPDYHCKMSINSTDNNSWIGPDRCSRYKVNRNWTERLSNETEPCLDGWDFSNETYTNTIVTEVWNLEIQQAFCSRVERDSCMFYFIWLFAASNPLLLESCLAVSWMIALSCLYHSGVWCVKMRGRYLFLPLYFL